MLAIRCCDRFGASGIDVDSCQNVLIEHNYLNVGDDHVTILAGVGLPGRTWNGGVGMPCKNITVVDNRLGTGMGISVGSSVSGGVQDVLYARNASFLLLFLSASWTVPCGRSPSPAPPPSPPHTHLQPAAAHLAPPGSIDGSFGTNPGLLGDRCESCCCCKRWG